MSNLCINHDYHEISDHWQICDICKNTVITRSKTSTLCEKIKKKPVLVYRCKWAKYHEYQTALSHLQWSTCIDITFDSKEQFMFSKKKTHCTCKRPFFPLAGLHDQSKALATSKIFSSCSERQSATIYSNCPIIYHFVIHRTAVVWIDINHQFKTIAIN